MKVEELIPMISISPAARLAKLEGDSFEEAICTLLARRHYSFQAIPSHPSGDGGLDGLSHNQSIAYCCYGLTQANLTSNTPKKIKNDICNKFRSDLKRLLELESSKKKGAGLLHTENSALKRIHTQKNKIKAILLMCNWFDHHEIVGSLNKSFQDYMSASKKRFVEPTCTLVVEGPTQIAARLVPSEDFFFAIENRRLIDLLSKAPALPTTLPDRSELDEKLDDLMQSNPKKTKLIANQKAAWHEEWLKYIVNMKDLDSEFPEIHRRVHEIIKQTVLSASLASASGGTAATAFSMIQTIRSELESRLLDDDVINFTTHHAKTFTDRTIAMMIAECPLDWR